MTVNLRKYQQAANDYEHLSLRDLVDARDLYHIYLMRHPKGIGLPRRDAALRRELARCAATTLDKQRSKPS